MSGLDQQFNDQLEQFLGETRSKMLAFAVFRIRDEETALDLLQEAMIGFINSAHRYEKAAWTNLFYKILTRRITDWQRKQAWRQKLRHIMPFSQLDVEQNERVDAAGIAEPSLNNPVESQQISDELAQQFEQLLQTLPPRQQEAYLLRQWQGMSIRETASIMQCTEGSVKTHFFRAMQTLKAQLGGWVDGT